MPNQNQNPNPNPNRNSKNSRLKMLYILLIAVFAFIVVSQLIGPGASASKQAELSTSEFITAVNEHRVQEVTYRASAGTLSGTYWETTAAKDSGADPLEFTSTFVGEDALAELMADNPDTNYIVDVRSSSIWMSLLATFLPVLLIVGLMWYFLMRMGEANNKQMGFGKIKDKKQNEERPKVKFSDVAGIDEAVEELQEVKEFLSNPAKFQALGAKIPRGVLLVGPPGTGKTLLAKAVAGEAGVPFFSISGSDFVEMFVGVGASRVRDLFEQAKAAAPAIIFIDEIDAVGRQRGAGLGGGHDEREQTLNQLLVEMDGFESADTVILIAATNRVDILDPALLRPGRFDRQVVVDRPDLKGREKILEVHSKGKPLASDVSLETLARLTPGFTGADLANLMNEGALLAARRGKSLISMEELNEAMERVVAGPERKSRLITDKEKRTIAYHESGHALVGHKLDNTDPVHKISIIARGQALGYTLQLPVEDRFLESRNEMLDQLAVFLAGRTAEELCCDDITTGASNDLERATKMAKQMVTQFGFSDKLGTMTFGEANHEVFLGRDYTNTPTYSEETANRIDEEVASIMRTAHERAEKIIRENRDLIDKMAEVLLERETVEGEAAIALLDGRWDEYLLEEKDIIAAKEAENKAAEDARRAADEQAAIAARARALDAAVAAGVPPIPGGANRPLADGTQPGIGAGPVPAAPEIPPIPQPVSAEDQTTESAPEPAAPEATTVVDEPADAPTVVDEPVEAPAEANESEPDDGEGR